MATSPAFASTPRAASAVVSAANSARDGSGTLATVMTAGAAGSRVDEVVILAHGTTTAGAIRLFVHDGTTARCIYEQMIAAVTPTTAQRTERYSLPFSNLYLPIGYSLRASTNNAESFTVTAFGGDF